MGAKSPVSGLALAQNSMFPIPSLETRVLCAIFTLNA